MFAPDLLNEASWRNSFEIEDKQGKGLRLAKGLAAHNMRELPEDFELGEYDVICGRGRKCFHHIGNQRFREIVLDLLDKYSDSSSKLDKSYIICDVVNRVRKSSPLGGFVKRDANTGRYYEVGDFLAREKTSQAFRDALQEQYKSSSIQKKKRRWTDQEKFLEQQNSAPLLNVSSIRESLEDDVLGSGDDEDSFHLEDDIEYSKPPTDRAVRPELTRSLSKQHSAPSIYHSFLGKYDNSGHQTSETQSFSGSSRSLFAYSESSDDSFHAQSAGIDAEIRANPWNEGLYSRRSFLGLGRNKSMRSVVEEEERQVAAPPDWCNRSCPAISTYDYESGSLLPPFKNTDFEPLAVFSSEYPLNHNVPVHGFSALDLDAKVVSPNESPLNQIAKETDIDDEYLKLKVNQDDIVLSPIGDGRVDGLFEILKGIEADGNENSRDIFEPLPF